MAQVMSVQAGIWNIDELPVSRQVLAKLSRELKPYGPDGETLYIHHCMGMLYRPFHTTPESRLEQQPLQFGRTKVITWDGRLDNRDELISQLLGDLTDDRSD